MGDRVIDFVYIASPSYSGSTLLTFLLAAHPEVASIGELKASAMGDADAYTCSCGAPIRRCPFWRRVCDELARRGLDFDLDDFQWDDLQPYGYDFLTVDDPTRFLFLDSRYSDYTAHVVQAFMKLRF